MVKDLDGKSYQIKFSPDYNRLFFFDPVTGKCALALSRSTMTTTGETLVGNVSEHEPRGSLDEIQAGPGFVNVCGWTYDPDTPERSSSYYVTVGGPLGIGQVSGELTADDLHPGVDQVYGVGKKHGLSATVYTELTGTLDVYVYTMDYPSETPVLMGTGVAVVPERVVASGTAQELPDTGNGYLPGSQNKYYDDIPKIDEAVKDAMLDGNIMRLGNPFYIDLDGDGQLEYVSLEHGDDDWAPQSEDYYNGTYWIAIDGVYSEGYGENIQSSVYGVSLDGKRIDLIVFQEGPSDDPMCDFYRLADYGPVYCGDIADDIEDLVITEYGTVTGSVRTNIMDTSRIRMEWEQDSDGLIYPIEQDIYAFVSKHLPSSYAEILPYYVQLRYPLEVSDHISGQGSRIVIEPQPVYFSYTDNEQMVFVQAMDGTGGWLNVAGWTTQDKTWWFEGLWFAD